MLTAQRIGINKGVGMTYHQLRSCRVLLLGALGGCVLLAACQPVSNEPTVVAVTPAVIVASPTAGAPTVTPAPQSASALATDTTIESPQSSGVLSNTSATAAAPL